MTTRKSKKKMNRIQQGRVASIGSGILSFGYGKELAEKHAALSQRGFDVISSSNLRQVNQLIVSTGGTFKTLLIGPRVPEGERRALSRLFRRRRPDANVIFFYRGSITNAEGATVILSEQRSPENLLDTMTTFEEERSSRDSDVIAPEIRNARADH
jgi:hypothetical protein